MTKTIKGQLHVLEAQDLDPIPALVSELLADIERVLRAHNLFEQWLSENCDNA